MIIEMQMKKKGKKSNKRLQKNNLKSVPRDQ